MILIPDYTWSSQNCDWLMTAKHLMTFKKCDDVKQKIMLIKDRHWDPGSEGMGGNISIFKYFMVEDRFI